MSARLASCVLLSGLVTCLLSGAAAAACYGPGQALSADTIDGFLKGPAALIENPANADGGPQFIQTVRDLASSSPATIQPILSLLTKANPAQRTAIGTGLANAANLCMGTKSREDALYAIDIQSKLAAAPDSKEAFDRFAALTPNMQSGAVGGGGGGFSSGGSGGQTTSTPTPTGFSGTFQPFANHGTPSGITNYFNGGVTGASPISFSTRVLEASTTVTR